MGSRPIGGASQRTLLAVVLVASCALPSVELVDSLGSGGASAGASGDGGASGKGGASSGDGGDAGDATGGTEPNAGSSGSSGSGGSSNGGSTSEGGSTSNGGGAAEGNMAGTGGDPGYDCPTEQPPQGEACTDQGAQCDYVAVTCTCDGNWDCGGDWALSVGNEMCYQRLPRFDAPCASDGVTCRYTPLDNCTVYELECSASQWILSLTQDLPDEGADCVVIPHYCIGDGGTDCVCTGGGWSCGVCGSPVQGDPCDSEASDIICDDGEFLCFCVEGGPQDQTWACN